MIGFIALIGIEVKNSILLVDFTNLLRAAGRRLDDAIERAGQARFFPILLTTLTALGGLLPLALEGSPLYSPLAIVIMGGLVSSTILARLVTPVMYKLLAPEVEVRSAAGERGSAGREPRAVSDVMRYFTSVSQCAKAASSPAVMRSKRVFRRALIGPGTGAGSGVSSTDAIGHTPMLVDERKASRALEQLGGLDDTVEGRDALVLRDLEHRLARDAGQHAVHERGRAQRALRVDDEHVRGRRFGEMIVLVEHHDLVVAFLARLPGGHRGAEVVGSRLRVDGQVRLDAPARRLELHRDRRADSARVRLASGSRRAPGRRRPSRPTRARPSAPRRPPRTGRYAITLSAVQPGFARDDRDRRRAERVVAGLDRQPDDRHRALEALEVLAEPEDRRAPRRRVHREVVEDQRAARGRVREQVDARVGPGDEGPVDPDAAVGRLGGAHGAQDRGPRGPTKCGRACHLPARRGHMIG